MVYLCYINILLCVLHLCDLIYFKIIFCVLWQHEVSMSSGYRLQSAWRLVTKYCCIICSTVVCIVQFYVGVEIESTCVYAQTCYRRSSLNCLHFLISRVGVRFVSYCMYFMMCKYWESLDKLPVFYLQNQLPQFFRIHVTY